MTTTATPTRRLPRWLVGGGAIAVAMAVMNVTTYGFTILAARHLGPPEYGALAAVMGLLLVLNVVSLGLQATGARRLSAAPAERAGIEADVLATSVRSAVALGLLSLALSPLVASLLNLDSWTTGAMIAVTVVPLTIMGGQAGILQGERRWAPLAAIYLAVGIGRLLFGGIGLLVGGDTFGAMVGVAVGAAVPVAIGWLALRHPASAVPAPSGARPAAARVSGPGTSGVIWETLHNSHALLAFFALSNADVVIARIVLPEHTAGLYAGGLILVKAVLFLPQFVVVIAFPSMSAPGSRRRMHLMSVAVVLAIGTLTVAATYVLSGLALTFIGGPEYDAIRSQLWVFAVIGTVLSALQVLVYSVVARQRQRAVFVIWTALAVLVALSPMVGSIAFLLTAVLCVDVGLFVAMLTSSLRHTPATPAAPAAPAQ